MKCDLSRYNNSWYKPGRNVAVRSMWFITNALFFINPLNPSSSLKVFLMRLFGAKIGKGVVIKPGVNIKYPWNIVIGNYTWIGENVWIDSLATVSTGSNCCISQGAIVVTGNHNYNDKHFGLMVKPVIIEDGAWLGAKSVVAPGVTVATHSVLALNSVAMRSTKPYTIYRGNPAIEVKKRNIT
ncbi:WcaF family extracellular polysaccharide biosynthesis acetyltransferase [Marinilabiliaceae bacterium ANBcel2]|nr:WcaF family extracellular polysaccharide biosynthesis acetyltransferase [Marinilabiliaceae bacterium ANBcel2]